MEKIILPPKYYLDHFLEMVKTLKTLHGFLLEDHNWKFIKKFESLSEDAQCLYIRIANRKGILFDKRSFEFNNWEELESNGFIRKANLNDSDLFLGWVKKDLIKIMLDRRGTSYKKSLSRDALVEILSSSPLEADAFNDLVIHESYQDLQYLLFIFFGKIQESLILYTLRDLGIRKTSAKKIVKPKFESIEEAKSLYFYSTLDSVPETWPTPIGAEAKEKKEKMLLSFVEDFKKDQQPIKALELLRKCKTYPGSEKKVRLLFELGFKDECYECLQKMMDDPTHDEEILFAEDFLSRKFGSKRLSLLTEALRNARQLLIDDSFYRHPEFGVVDYYKKQNIVSHFAENDLWSAIFGMFFHDQLLLVEGHSEFDRLPDLKGKISYSGLGEWDWESALEKDYSDSELFILDEQTKTMVSDFLKVVSPNCLDVMLSYLSEDFWNRQTGFPDLFVIEENEIKFIEVKAEGDSLKNGQLKQLRELEKAGFKVEILNVKYRYTPDQVYVVVDIETTGHLSPFNRITEVAAVKVMNGQVVDRFQSLINPQRSIPRDIQSLTGITNEMVARAPAFHEVADLLHDFTKDAIFVAHNVQFDYGFIQKEFERIEKRFVRPYICTKVGMRKHYPKLESYGLKNLTRHFNIPLEHHHRAMSDAEAASGLLHLINQKRSEINSLA